MLIGTSNGGLLEMAVHIRKALPGDLPQAYDIYTFYVRETVLTFLTLTPPFEVFQQRFDASLIVGLPWLAAVDDESQKVIGYAYASAFRSSIGYGHTVEITIFCHPQQTGKGIGSKLLGELLKALCECTHAAAEAGHEKAPVDFKVKKAIAVMSVDETGPGGGLALRDWYLRHGFEQVGRLRGVGNKHGRE